MKNTFNNLKDSGKAGKNFEVDLKKYLNLKAQVSSAGSVDLYHYAGHNIEVKTCSGECCQGQAFKPWRNSTLLIYCPVVDPALPVEKQEAFVITREAFVKILLDLNLVKYNKSRDKWNIQTFWNNSKGEPHGKKYFALLDRLYEECEATLEEWLEERLEG